MPAGTSLHAELIVDGAPRKLAPEAEENLLHLCQKALTNALRHASANRFTARFGFARRFVRLKLHDDGCGFDVAANHEGFGRTGVRERLESLDGRFSIESTAG
jgi:signal transduction histidine kinase